MVLLYRDKRTPADRSRHVLTDKKVIIKERKNMFNKNLFANKLKGIEPYVVDTGKYKARLDANESFIPLREDIRKKLCEVIESFDFNRYPDPHANDLKVAFCDYYGLKTGNVCVGNGSDEIISLLMNCFVDFGKSVMVFTPDFSMYAFYASLVGLSVVQCPKKADFSIDFDLAEKAIKENDVKLVIFSNPCNPTGKIENKSDIKELAQKCPETIFVVDEAYMDFASIKNTESFLKETEEYENLIVLKTLSKALGAAALRLGFLVADKKFCDMLYAVKSPYNVNGLSQKCGEVLLKEKAYLDECTKSLCDSCESLYKEIVRSGIGKPDATYTNFVFFKDERAQEKQTFLRENGVLIRKFGIDGGALRITSGTSEENALVIKTLGEFKN